MFYGILLCCGRGGSYIYIFFFFDMYGSIFSLVANGIFLLLFFLYHFENGFRNIPFYLRLNLYSLPVPHGGIRFFSVYHASLTSSFSSFSPFSLSLLLASFPFFFLSTCLPFRYTLPRLFTMLLFFCDTSYTSI